MKLVLLETPPAPPAAAAMESTTRIRRMRGGLPSASSRSPSAPIATTVPMVSKKSASSRVKTSRTTVTQPTASNEPSREKCPSVAKSGAETHESGSAGTFRPQARGLTTDPSAPVRGPRWATASTTTARTVAATIPPRMAPRTPRAMRTIISTRPTTKTSVGQPARKPPMPSSRGVPLPARTNPASTSPTMVMNRPMPTLMAVFSGAGTARKTASRSPVRTSTRMTSPSMTTSPMASAHVMSGRLATPKARKAFRPSPVARARG
ncbi:hypothetical protein BJ968_004671 [Kineococcus aurantiacus]|uniref:Uncharacterized protein n=1 Tax=Kineococcus aurantiacus TaxID=37633 RepID=A0A7Y9DQP2_9ACTN|nr:hypothetical protein [Kineococcus aurantiacus]NYD25062.1 hypothetical protein [Kineococcus aurantiacus]